MQPGMSASKVDQARKLAWDILASDEAVLGIVVADSEGSYLAYAGKEEREAKVLTDQDQIRRIGTKEFLGLRLAPRPGQDSGEVEYLSYVYENFRLVITELRNPRFIVGVKLTRSSNVEFVWHKVLLKYR